MTNCAIIITIARAKKMKVSLLHVFLTEQILPMVAVKVTFTGVMNTPSLDNGKVTITTKISMKLTAF